MSTNVRLIIAIALSLGVVLAFGLLTERGKGNDRETQPAADAGAQVQAILDAAAVPMPASPPAAPVPAPDAATTVVADAVAAAPLDGGLATSPASPAPPLPAEASATVPPPPAEPAQAGLENAVVAMTVASRRGALVAWKLKDSRFNDDVNGVSIPVDMASTVDGVFGLYCYDAADLQGNYADVCPDEYTVRRQADKIFLDSLPRPGARVKVRQVYTLGSPEDPYAVHRTLVVGPAEPGVVVQNLVLWVSLALPPPRNASSGGFLSPATNVQKGLCRYNDDLGRTSRTDVAPESRWHGTVDWVGIEDGYFLSAFGFAHKDPPGRKDFCVLDIVRAEPRQPLRATLQFSPLDLSGERTFSLVGHLGPKSLDHLRGVTEMPSLDEAIDYGWFDPLCIVMLRVMDFFHAVVGNWVLAIVLLTVLVKLVLLPLTHWSMVSMRRMSALKPLLDEINEKYKDDKQRKNQAVMDLYKTHKVNPLGGCFPLLLQMPIWIALYRMLGASAELYHVPFLWLPDLTRADPYYVLPIVLGLSMFVQQKMTPTTGDSSQAKVMLYLMPVMFTVFMLFLPAGLNLYILTNTVLSIAQQQITNRLVPVPVLAAAKGASLAPPRVPAGAEPAQGGGTGGRSRRKR